jgi:hypothetical protein
MHRSFKLMLLAVTSVAVPVFAQGENQPTGTWRGSVDRNGEQSPMILRLVQKEGLWKGRADVAGSASPLTKVQVDGKHVRFTIKGQGTFDGTCSQDTFTGSVAGSKKGRPPASFTLTRQEESNEDLQIAIDSVVESSGP